MTTHTEGAPSITIGITAYNEGQWLQDCWGSVLAQDDPRWEAVMVLDGGADPLTQRIFESIAHPRLRKFALNENGGPYPARTRAIRAANTGWYAHLDADDRLPPEMVGAVLAAIDTHPDAAFVFGDVRFFHGADVRLHRIPVFDVEGLVVSPVVHGQTSIQISLFDTLGGFAPELLQGGADWDFWLGVAELGVQGVHAGAVLYERRERPDSVGAGWRFRRADVAQTLIDRHPAYFAGESRRNRCLAIAHEMTARDYRAAGSRKPAAHHAREAISFGAENPVLETILNEAEMPGWRYWLRRLGRLLR